MRQGKLQDLEVVTRMLEDQLQRFQDHSRRLTQLEAVRNRGCEKKSDRNARLIQDLFDRVNRLEDRLNFTLNQNQDLRQELQSLKVKLTENDHHGLLLRRKSRAILDYDEYGMDELGNVGGSQFPEPVEKPQPTPVPENSVVGTE